MHPTATRENYLALSHELQVKHALVLGILHRARLPCRCEMVGGRDFTIVVSQGLSAAKYWLDRFDIDPKVAQINT